MDWTFTLHSVVATMTSAVMTFYMISQYQIPVEKLVDLISLGDYTEASVLWNTILTSNQSQPSFNKTELIEKIFTKSFQTINASNVSIKLSKFVHLSLTKYDKPQGYYQLYQAMDSNQLVFNNSYVFPLAKYILDDKVQNVKIFGIRNANLNMLGVISKAVWSSLQQQQVMLRNRKHSSYLYIDGNGQMLGWNNRLTNERQALFKFHPRKTAVGGEDVLSFEIIFENSRLGVKTKLNEIQSPGSIFKESGKLTLSQTTWTLALVSPTAFRIFLNTGGDVQGILVLKKSGVSDDPRSQVYAEFSSRNSSLGAESIWDVVNYN